MDRMCRNITTLRGLEPHATHEEIEAAARQYVRKISRRRIPARQQAQAAVIAPRARGRSGSPPLLLTRQLGAVLYEKLP